MDNLNKQIESVTKQAERVKLELRLLKLQRVAKLAQQHPDCEVKVYFPYGIKPEVWFQCNLGEVDPRQTPIDHLANNASSYGYYYNTERVLFENDKLLIRLVVTADQRFTKAEEKFLRKMGVMKTHRQPGYKAISCGIN